MSNLTRLCLLVLFASSACAQTLVTAVANGQTFSFIYTPPGAVASSTPVPSNIFTQSIPRTILTLPGPRPTLDTSTTSTTPTTQTTAASTSSPSTTLPSSSSQTSSTQPANTTPATATTTRSSATNRSSSSTAAGGAVNSANANASSQSRSSSSGLSNGAIAGIAVACALVGLALAALLIWILLRRRRRQKGDLAAAATLQEGKTDEMSNTTLNGGGGGGGDYPQHPPAPTHEPTLPVLASIAQESAFDLQPHGAVGGPTGSNTPGLAIGAVPAYDRWSPRNSHGRYSNGGLDTVAENSPLGSTGHGFENAGATGRPHSIPRRPVPTSPRNVSTT